MKFVEMVIWRLFGFGLVLTICGAGLNAGLMGPLYEKDPWLLNSGLALLAISIVGMVVCAFCAWINDGIKAGKDKLK
jgi:hypothetical protein